MKRKTIILILIMLLALSGCCPCDCGESTAEAVIQPPTGISVPTITSTAMPTSTIEPTIALTNIPRITPLPTLTLSNHALTRAYHDKFLEFLANNGCQLPCFWGITPGQTSLSSAINSLSIMNPFSDWRYLDPEEGSWKYRGAFEVLDGIFDYILIEIDYRASENMISALNFKAYQASYNPNGDIIDYESIHYGNVMKYYMLSSILAEYGPPDQVYLMPVILEGSSADESSRFHLMLMYAQQGFAVHYHTRLQVRGDQALGCMNNAPVEFELLAPDNPDTFYESLSFDWTFRMETYTPLDNATEMTVESFYETFRNPTDQCIETPLDFWYGDNP